MATEAKASVKYPQTRDMVPDFVLASSTGKQVQASSFRGRRDLVLVFVGNGAAQPPAPVPELLKGLAAAREELNDEEAQLLILLRGDMVAAEALRKRDSLPFVALADRDGEVHERYGAGDGAVVITDRYGEIYGIYREQIPSADDVMASLRHINAACPE